MPASFFRICFQQFQRFFSAGVKIPVSGSLSSDAFDTAWNLAGWMGTGTNAGWGTAKLWGLILWLYESGFIIKKSKQN